MRTGKFLFFVSVLFIGILVGTIIVSRLDMTPVSNAGVEEPKKAAAGSTSMAAGLQDAFIDVAERAGPAVVSISTVKKHKIGQQRQFFFGTPFGDKNSPFGDDIFDRFFKDFFEGMPEREYEQKGLGSGVIIDAEGFILTNEHVISGADEITVSLPDGRQFEGKVKGADPRSDLAVIKIKPEGDLPAVELGDSDAVRIGQWSIAIGNPFAYMVDSSQPTITVGVVSAVNRSFRTATADKDYTGLIQTDAAINPGNSGGPLVDIDGKVIGINVAIFSTSGGYQGVGFAIPVNRAKDILEDLIEGRKVLYGWLGIQVQEVDEELAEYFGLEDTEGVLVAKVLEDTPALKGGMKDGDVIKTIDGKPVKKVRDLLKIVGRIKVGKKVKVEIIRDKKPKTLTIEIGERPGELEKYGEMSAEVWRGIEVANITEELAQKYKIEDKKGVIVTNVEYDSVGFKSGIRVGDLIEEINRVKIESVAKFNEVVSKIQGDALVRTTRGYTIVKVE